QAWSYKLDGFLPTIVMFMSSPTEVVMGHGLYALPTACDRWKESGVSECPPSDRALLWVRAGVDGSAAPAGVAGMVATAVGASTHYNSPDNGNPIDPNLTATSSTGNAYMPFDVGVTGLREVSVTRPQATCRATSIFG